MNFRSFKLFALCLCALSAMNYVAAQTPPGPPLNASSADAQAGAESRGLNDWLNRMHQASKNRSYIGTFVVSTGGTMSSAKIWHACEGGEQIERVETLTGAPRSTFRHKDQVVTFIPEHKVARIEQRDSLGRFPELLQSGESRIADFYRFSQDGVERVAGVDADVVVLSPKDELRFGFRLWAERKSGLVIKAQTLDANAVVLEQAAFSELQLDAPVRMDRLAQMMGNTEGWRIEKPQLLKTTAYAEGWVLKTPVAGFNSISCFKRVLPGQTGDASLQWTFSDGLAAVSIFIEPIERQRQRPSRETGASMGATHMLGRQVDSHWITIVGEVPMTTLRLFAGGVQRKK